MNYLIMLGSNMFYGSNGVIHFQKDKRFIDFFKIRQIYQQRSNGSYLAVDCDIKDSENKRIIKLAKNNPVAGSDELKIDCDKQLTNVETMEGELVIRIEQLTLNSNRLIDFEPVNKMILTHPFGDNIKNNLAPREISAAIKITGHFNVGSHELLINDDYLTVDNRGKLKGNFKSAEKGIILHKDGFSF